MRLRNNQILFLFLIITLLNSCRRNDEIQEDQNSNFLLEQESESKISFLALGDSYSVGEGLEGEQNWPKRLFDSIKKNKDTIKIIR